MAIYKEIYDGPPHNYTATRTTKRYIAIHNTSNDATAEQEASYAKRRTDSVSSHYYVDGDSIVQSLDTDYRAWHAGNREGNDRAIAYEITGVNGWTRQQWLDRVAWRLLAAQIRRDCIAHGITPRDLSVDQVKAGNLTGIITHNEMRLAWGGTDHTDPGPNFPMDHLIRLLAEEDDMPLTDQDIAKVAEATRRELFEFRFGSPAQGVEDRRYLEWIKNAGRAVDAYANTQTLVTGQQAILAAIAGEDVAQAAAEAARVAVREEFAALGPALAAELDGVTVEQITEALSRLRLVADET